MNVEHSQTATPQGRSVGGVHGKSGKASASPAAGDAPEGGGFLSLLAFLSGDDGPELQDVASVGVDGAVVVGANDISAAALLPDGSGSAAVAAAAAAPGSTTIVSDGTAAVMPLWASPEQMLQGRRVAEQPAAKAPSQDAGMEGVRLGEESVAGAAHGVSAHAASPADKGLKIGQDEALRELPGPLGRAVSEQMQAQAASKHLAFQAAANAAGAALSNNGADAAARAKAQVDNVRAEMSNPVTVATEQALTSALTTPATAERRSDKAFDPGARFIGDAGWHRPVLTPGNGVEVSAASAGASVGDPGRQVAEQVSYWIANDVQNAEFKLDQFGESPVEVSISLQGNEARVEFRTDMLEMRRVLQDAVTQLKDMLQSQGLVLAGVSVGGSGADAPGQRESQAERPNVRQTTVAAASAVRPVGTAANAAPGVGRALDVFV